jgi:hypothetical protein
MVLRIEGDLGDWKGRGSGCTLRHSKSLQRESGCRAEAASRLGQDSEGSLATGRNGAIPHPCLETLFPQLSSVVFPQYLGRKLLAITQEGSSLSGRGG